MSSPLVGVAAVNAVSFGIYGNLNRCFSNPDSNSSKAIAGMTSGLAQVRVLFKYALNLALILKTNNTRILQYLSFHEFLCS